MTSIELDLKIEGIDVSKHDIVVKINGCPMPTNSPDVSFMADTSFSSKGFGAYVLEESQRLLTCHRARSAEIHKSVSRQFMLWRKGEDVSIDAVTSNVIEQFETYLRSRNLSLNTISFYMRVLRSCYNKAIEEYNIPSKQPFKRVYTGIEQTDKRALSIEIIREIKRCFTDDRDVQFARDMFMFSFYTRGMSFVDMAYLKRENIKNGWLHYKRHKTGQSIAVKWEACMQEIVDRYSPQTTIYLLPIIHSSNGKERNQYRGIQHKVNRLLKVIALQCGLNSNLTMYVARHSWASVAQSLNHPLELISYGMGHTSTKTTKIYLNTINMSQIDQLNTAVLQEVNSQ